MEKEKKPVKIMSDEKDFSAVLDIIKTHRSRTLMSNMYCVNRENEKTFFWGGKKKMQIQH